MRCFLTFSVQNTVEDSQGFRNCAVVACNTHILVCSNWISRDGRTAKIDFGPHVSSRYNTAVFRYFYHILHFFTSQRFAFLLRSTENCLSFKNGCHSSYVSTPIPQNLSPAVYHTPVGLEHGMYLAPFSAELPTNVPSLFSDFHINSRRITVY